MKPILVAVGTVGLFTAPAVAGNKKNRDTAKPSTVVAAKTETKPAGVAAALAAVVDAPATVLDIPVLPPDTSSALSPMPELEKLAAATVVAKPAKLSAAAKTPLLKIGKDYVLGGRDAKRTAAKPGEREVVEFIPRSLTQAQVATVVQSHMSDIQNCWDLVPKAHRADACTAMLRLTIADDGAVTDIELGGDVPAGAHKCLTSAIAKWQFPAAEAKSEIEYGISLRSL
jgi:hypothetical protein